MKGNTVIALAGNPNCGKTTLFNALTGANQFVGRESQLRRRKVSSRAMTALSLKTFREFIPCLRTHWKKLFPETI